MTTLSEQYNKKIEQLVPSLFDSDGQAVKCTRVIIALAPQRQMNESTFLRQTAQKYGGQFATHHGTLSTRADEFWIPTAYVDAFKQECFTILDLTRSPADFNVKELEEDQKLKAQHDDLKAQSDGLHQEIRGLLDKVISPDGPV